MSKRKSFLILLSVMLCLLVMPFSVNAATKTTTVTSVKKGSKVTVGALLQKDTSLMAQ